MQHEMNALMTGMFWGGVLMSLPPVALGIWIAWALLRRQREERAAERPEGSGDQL